MRSIVRGASFAALTLFALAACADITPPSQEEDALVPAFAVQPGHRGMSELARSVPGFGGLYLEADGTATVWLTNENARVAATRAIRAFLRREGVDATAVRVRQADFGWQELEGWFAAASNALFEVPGVVFVDLDERRNRVTIGVEQAAIRGRAGSVLAQLRVPDQAINVMVTPAIVPAATLRDAVSPRTGGLQIHFSNFLCTLGFNAVRSGQNSFITNSHCTERQGRRDGTSYYQPLSSVPNSFIGNEVADPSYFRKSPCPRGARCRYSDAARAAYASGVAFDLGGIARTTGPNNGSLTLAGTFNVTGEGDGLAGQTANKIGRTTGWTAGTITNTCVNTGVSGSNQVLLCQTFVSAGVGGGDSGSPVFRTASGDNVTLLGILWGGSSDGSLFVFSPIDQVEQELGALTTF
ncbi:MAG: hypothetical protein ACREL7_16530 [Longimicrobiales bacterium]